MSRVVFVDTSALYAVHDRDDVVHSQAAAVWATLLDGMEDGSITCFTHSAVVVESSALVQRRLGLPALRALHHQTLPVTEIVWVGPELHAKAVSALLAAGSGDVSLVDWTSFELMRERGVLEAFAFDDDFLAQGFETAFATS